MFLRHALVDGDWDGQHAFVQANKERVADVVALEDRVRRDLLVSDDDLVAFFDARVPGRRHHGPPLRPLVEAGAARAARTSSPTRRRTSSSRAAGPSTWPGSPTLAAGRRPASRSPTCSTRPPTSTASSSTCRSRCSTRSAGRASTGRCPGAATSWSPRCCGRCPRRCAATSRPRPTWRRRCWPRVGPDDGPLLDVLAAGPHGGVGVRRSGRTTSTSPRSPATCGSPTAPSTRAGRPLAWSQDLPALRRRMADRVREALAASAPVDEVTGATSWVFGTIPATVSVDHAGLAVTGYPALVDEGDDRRPAGAAVRGRAARRRCGEAPAGCSCSSSGHRCAPSTRRCPNATKLALAGSHRAERGRGVPRVRGGGRRPAPRRAGRAGVRRGRVRERCSRRCAPGSRRRRSRSARLVGEILASADAVEAALAVDAHRGPRRDGARRRAPTSTGCSTGAGSPPPASTASPTWRATCGPSSTGSTRPAPSRTATGATSPASRRSSGTTAASPRATSTGAVRTMLEELRVSTFAQSVGRQGRRQRAEGPRRPRPAGLIQGRSSGSRLSGRAGAGVAGALGVDGPGGRRVPAVLVDELGRAGGAARGRGGRRACRAGWWRR